MKTGVSDRPAVVQSDRSVLLEIDHPGYEDARKQLCRFAELQKSPEHVHTYRITDLSLWNAATAGISVDEVIASLGAMSRFEVAAALEREIRDVMRRHGVCRLEDAGEPGWLVLGVSEPNVLKRLLGDRKAAPMIVKQGDRLVVQVADRGPIKRAILALGYPVDDRAGLVPGAPLQLELQREGFELYPYQREAVRAFVDSGSHGVVVLACGAGKTLVGLAAIQALGVRALVVTTSREACNQWRREALRRTTLQPADVALYHADAKRVGPVTITTYGMLAQKGGGGATGCKHFDVLAAEPWGLIVYDEVHLLPAPVFRLAAELQARRRLGLTATLVREDGRQGEVFALVGPKRYDVPWRELEASGHIAAATCFELRVALDPSTEEDYAAADARERHRVAAENPAKVRVVGELLERHHGDRVLLLGSFLDTLRGCATAFGIPLITGETPHAAREEIYDDFRAGRIRQLALSRVGGLALDLPDANVLIQINGTMGSRQEEAQRLGRILRPKPGGASFYTLVSTDTVEQETALHRQLFLTEQGYRYYIEDARPHPEHETRGPNDTLH